MRDYGSLWVRRIVERANTRVGSPILSGVLTLGWIPVATALGILVLERNRVSADFVTTQLLVSSIIFFGPYQAYKYDKCVLPQFFSGIEAIVAEESTEEFERVRRSSLEGFRSRHAPAVFVWTVVVVSVLPLNHDYFATQGIAPGEISYVLMVVFLINFGVLSGLGLFSGWITVQSIRQVSTLELTLQPFHRDGLGGLSPIGRLASWTALLIANGSLAIPFSIEIISTPGGIFMIYSGISIYVSVIAFSFVYPLWAIYRETQSIRRERLQHYREKIESLKAEIQSTEDPDLEDVVLRLRIEKLRGRHRQYQRLRLYPASVRAATKFAVSVVLPVFFSFLRLFTPLVG